MSHRICPQLGVRWGQLAHPFPPSQVTAAETYKISEERKKNNQHKKFHKIRRSTSHMEVGTP